MLYVNPENDVFVVQNSIVFHGNIDRRIEALSWGPKAAQNLLDNLPYNLYPPAIDAHQQLLLRKPLKYMLIGIPLLPLCFVTPLKKTIFSGSCNALVREYISLKTYLSWF
jgi:hypothetical protein